jgi:hypothetical protein
MDLRHPFFGCLVEWSVSVKAYSMKMLAHPSLIFLGTKPSSGHCLPPLTRDLILTEARAGKSACARERATERALTQAAKLTTGRSGSGLARAAKERQRLRRCRQGASQWRQLAVVAQARTGGRGSLLCAGLAISSGSSKVIYGFTFLGQAATRRLVEGQQAKCNRQQASSTQQASRK